MIGFFHKHLTIDVALIVLGAAGITIGIRQMQDSGAAPQLPVTASAQATEEPPPPGTGRTVVTQPTAWGSFVVTPVLNGTPAGKTDAQPVPELTGASARSAEADGPNAPVTVASRIRRFVDIPAVMRHGLAAVGAQAAEDNEAFRSFVVYIGGDGTANPQSMRLTAYTPTEAIPILSYPDRGLYVMRLSHDVAGYPTITVVPNPTTADPRGERKVMWTQGKAVYVLETFGDFANDEVIGTAAAISSLEAVK